MRILVIGATGTIGRAVVEALSPVTRSSRPASTGRP